MIESATKLLLAFPQCFTGGLERGDVLNLRHKIERLACVVAYERNGEARPDHLVRVTHQTLFDLITRDLSTKKLLYVIVIDVSVLGKGYLSKGFAE